MPVPIPSSSHLIKPYHRYNHILLQFILRELISAYEHLEGIDRMLCEKGISLSDTDQFIKLAKFFSQLTGSDQYYMRLFTWSEDGILAKLRHYTLMFSDFNSKAKKYRELLFEAEGALAYATEALEMLRRLPRECTTREVKKIMPTVKKLSQQLNRYSKKMQELLKSYQYNENLLFFILIHQIELNKIYQKNFVNDFLEKSFSNNIQEAKEFISSKYDKRGFNHLLPMIEDKIKALG